MEPDFKQACLAIKPYFDTFANQFLDGLHNSVFAGDEANFTQAKHQVSLIEQMKRTIINETCEGDE